MSQLRKEYKEFKQFQEDIFMEAAEAWTEENVILINERLNRNAIYRLNSAIERFDNKFGPYKDKLPAIADILNNAENGLHLVITGKVGSRTTAQMLQRMSIMYNILSNFFSGDLGALLKTPAFRVAHEQPHEKIDKIVDRGHDVKAIRRTLASALKPNDEERMLFRRAYKSFDMPNLDWNMAAKQLSCLSCNELQDLAGIERVPMVVADEQPNVEISDDLEEASLRTNAANIASKAGGVAVGGAVAGSVIGAKALANRFSGPTQQDLKSMNVYLNAIKKVLPVEEPEFASAKQGLEKLIANIKKAETGAKVNFDQNWLRNPTAIAISQGKQLIDIFEKLGATWNTIKSKYKSPLSDEDIKTIEKTLNQQVNSVRSKMGRFFKVNLPKGLTTKELIAALIAVAKRGAGEGETKENSSKTETASASENLSDQDKKDVAGFRSGGAGLRGFNPLGAGSGGGERSAAPVVRESYDYINHIFMSLPQKMTLSENFTSFLEHLELITEDFDDLDKVLTNFAKIKTDVDDKLEKTTQNVENQKASATKNSAAKPAPIVRDIQAADIQEAVAAKIPEGRIADINKQITNLEISGISTVQEAQKFLADFKSILEKDVELKELSLLAKLPELEGTTSGSITESKKQNLINQIKKIILEQLEEISGQVRDEVDRALKAAQQQNVAINNVTDLSNYLRSIKSRVTLPRDYTEGVLQKAKAKAGYNIAPATTAAPAAATTNAGAAAATNTSGAAPASGPAPGASEYPQLLKNSQAHIEKLKNVKTYEEMLKALYEIPPSDADPRYKEGEKSLGEQREFIRYFAKPETKNDYFVENIEMITTMGDLRGKVIDLQIAKMNVPGITNRATYKQYKSIIDSIEKVPELIAILKTGGTPEAASAPAQSQPAAAAAPATAPAATTATAPSKPAA